MGVKLRKRLILPYLWKDHTTVYLNSILFLPTAEMENQPIRLEGIICNHTGSTKEAIESHEFVIVEVRNQQDDTL